tara:strand:+ start:1320 stop:1568 length:249 start_codon:yes stop_codon:yes gene_type:complete
MITVPESDSFVDQCCSWYYSTIEARDIDYMSGMIKKMTWLDVKSLLEYRPIDLPIRDLAAMVFVIDETYLSHVSKQRQDAKE